jgi:AcrR family transcriptional regulator
VVHEGLIYSSDAEFLDVLVPFLREGVEAGERALVVLAPDRAKLLRDRLGPDAAGAVRFFDPDEWYRRPGVTLASWASAWADALSSGEGLVRAVGEPPVAREPARRTQWTRYEASLNRLYTDEPIWCVCPYDASSPAEVLDGCRKTHPTIASSRGRVPSAPYFAAHDFVPVFAPAAKIDRRAATVVTARSTGDLPALRRDVAVQARRHLSVSDAQDLALAITELSNAAFADSARSVTVLQRQADEEGWSCEARIEGVRPGPLAAGRGRIALAIAGIVCHRIEFADDAAGGLVRFVFPSKPAGARERILAAATVLFGRDGVRRTTVNAIAAEGSVAKATLYSLFPSKDALLAEWGRATMFDWLEWLRAEADARGSSPRERLCGWFDALADWIELDLAAGSPIMRVAIELRDRSHPAHSQRDEALSAFESYLRTQTCSADIADPESVVELLVVLAEGAITRSTERGSAEPAHTAARAVRTLISE